MKMVEKLVLLFASTLVVTQVAADGNFLKSLVLGASSGFNDDSESKYNSFVSAVRHSMQDFADMEDLGDYISEDAFSSDLVEEKRQDFADLNDFADYIDDDGVPIVLEDEDTRGYVAFNGHQGRHLQKKAKGAKAPASAKAPAGPKSSKKRIRRLQEKKSSKKLAKAPAAPKAPASLKAPASPKASKKKRRNRKLNKKSYP